MSVQGLATFFCIALALVMLSFPIWGPRYCSNHMSRPGGKRPTIWLIISLEALLVAGIIDIAQDGFWAANDLPLVLTLHWGISRSWRLRRRVLGSIQVGASTEAMKDGWRLNPRPGDALLRNRPRGTVA